MKNSKIVNYRSRFFKKLKRKVFFSNELKRALLIAFYEARSNQTYVNIDFLLYGLLAEPKSLASRLILLTYSQFLNTKNLTLKNISSKIQKINKQNSRENLKKNNSSEFTLRLTSENKNAPFLNLEVKEVLFEAVKVALQTNKKVVVVNSKHILLNLLAKESIRNFLTNLVQ